MLIFQGNRNQFNDIGVVLIHYFTQCPNPLPSKSYGGDFWDFVFVNLFTYGREIFQTHKKKLCHVASIGGSRCHGKGRNTLELFYF